MIATVNYKGKVLTADLTKPIDISIPLRAGEENVNAWYLDPVRIEPVVMGEWVGDVQKGGSVNFRNIFFNPHGHGTHTECVGHISHEWYSINQELKSFFTVAKLITIVPEKKGEDHVITLKQIKSAMGDDRPEAILIRTPNEENKINKQYSNTNPAYLQGEAANYLREIGIMHLLIDLPSVDPEKDEGRLEAHKAFWNYPEATRTEATITELIYVNDSVTDGIYLLNLMIAPFENDASPSKPVLYKLS